VQAWDDCHSDQTALTNTFSDCAPTSASPFTLPTLGCQKLREIVPSQTVFRGNPLVIWQLQRSQSSAQFLQLDGSYKTQVPARSEEPPAVMAVHSSKIQNATQPRETRKSTKYRLVSGVLVFSLLALHADYGGLKMAFISRKKVPQVGTVTWDEHYDVPGQECGSIMCVATFSLSKKCLFSPLGA
jgi:hypothetical protein